MEALYKLFALSYIVEHLSWIRLESWKNIAALQGLPEPEYAKDPVYKILADEWIEASQAFEQAGRDLIREHRKQQAEDTLTVTSGS